MYNIILLYTHIMSTIQARVMVYSLRNVQTDNLGPQFDHYEFVQIIILFIYITARRRHTYNTTNLMKVFFIVQPCFIANGHAAVLPFVVYRPFFRIAQCFFRFLYNMYNVRIKLRAVQIYTRRLKTAITTIIILISFNLYLR